MGAWFANWVEAERGRFHLLLPVGMGTAILVYFALPTEPPVWLAFLLPAASLAALIAAWRYWPARLVAAILLAACLGFARAELRTAAEPPQPAIPSGAIGIFGTITQVELLPDSRRITLSHPRLASAPPLARTIRLRLRPGDTTALLATPEAIIGVSFQMSFSAVLALISGYAAVQPILHHLYSMKSMPGRIAVHLGALAYTSLLAGGASMPFAAYQFQLIPPYWIPANLIAVPLTAFWIMPWGLAALALMPVSLSAFALIPMGWGIGVIIWLTTRVAAWPTAMLRIPPMPDLAILLIAAGLIWLCIWRSGPRFAGILFLLAGLVVYAQTRPPDILVSPDAKLIAIHEGATIFLIREPKAAAFTLAQWAPVWGSTPLTPAQCTGNICRLSLR
jgi:Competence protein